MVKEIPHCESCQVVRKSCFSCLKPEDLADLKYEKSCSLYRRGQNIFQEDHRALGIYCLHEGKVKIFKSSADGREQIVRLAVPGDIFGLRSIIDVKYYGVNAQAIEDSVACFFSADTFVNLVGRFSKLSKILISNLSNLLFDAEEKISSLAHKPVRERLAELLIRIPNQYAVEGPAADHTINLSREDLANMIGSATETVIRLLSEFKDENLIAIEGRKITIVDIPRLARAANLSSPAGPHFAYYQDPPE